MTTRVEMAITATEELTDQELTDYVDWLREHMKDRSRRRNAKAKALIQVGDHVRIAGRMKPQYLTGLTGKVVEKRQSRVTVLLDRGPTKKFTTGRVILTPASLEVIP